MESLLSLAACIGTMNRSDWSAGGSPALSEEAANLGASRPRPMVGSWRVFDATPPLEHEGSGPQPIVQSRSGSSGFRLLAGGSLPSAQPARQTASASPHRLAGDVEPPGRFGLVAVGQFVGASEELPLHGFNGGGAR